MEFILLRSDESPWLSVLFDLLWSSHGAWKVFSVSVGILSFFCTMKFSLQRCRWCRLSLQKWESTCLWQERNPFGAGVQLQEKANSSRLEYSHWHVAAPLKSLVIYTPLCLETSNLTYNFINTTWGPLQCFCWLELCFLHLENSLSVVKFLLFCSVGPRLSVNFPLALLMTMPPRF